MKLEREVKLAAWGGFAVPPLDDVAPDVGAAPLKTKKLDATYYDTRDLRLARAGVSLRHRLGLCLGRSRRCEPGDRHQRSCREACLERCDLHTSAQVRMRL